MQSDLWQALKAATKPIVLYGMGKGADKILRVLAQKQIPVSGVFASDGFVRQKQFHGFAMESFADIRSRLGDCIVLLCFGSARPEVIANVKKIAAVCELYAPEVPVIGDGLFDAEYYTQNCDRLQKISDRLADALSRKTFTDIVRFKLSGKPDCLYDCETTADEPYVSFLSLQQEHYLDLGAYNGDTVLDFVHRCPGYSSVTAVEPDCKTFQKLVRNTQSLPRIECQNLCISDYTGKGHFGMRSGRGSGVCDCGTETDFITVDALMQNRPVTLIKMDVEGQELAALSGAETVIRTQKPKLIVSCYHRTEDLFSLPEKVLSLRPDYKVYMRHFVSLPAWDTVYYFL